MARGALASAHLKASEAPPRPGGFAGMPTLKKDRLKPIFDLDPTAQKLWIEITESFVGTDHFRRCDQGVVHAYVDSVINYLRVRKTVEEAHASGKPMSVLDLARLTSVMDKQSRLMAQLARELGFGPLARRHMGNFVDPDDIGKTIESFTVTGAGRKI